MLLAFLSGADFRIQDGRVYFHLSHLKCVNCQQYGHSKSFKYIFLFNCLRIYYIPFRNTNLMHRTLKCIWSHSFFRVEGLYFYILF